MRSKRAIAAWWFLSLGVSVALLVVLLKVVFR